jgi:hypothetical protein
VKIVNQWDWVRPGADNQLPADVRGTLKILAFVRGISMLKSISGHEEASTDEVVDLRKENTNLKQAVAESRIIG